MSPAAYTQFTIKLDPKNHPAIMAKWEELAERRRWTQFVLDAIREKLEREEE